MRARLNLILAVGRAYGGRTTGLIFVAICLGYAVVGNPRLPTFEQGVSLHLESLLPCVIAAVAGSSASPLFVLSVPPPDARLRWFRAGWLTTLSTASAMAMAPGAVLAHTATAVPASALLTALTVSTSALLGRACWLIPAVDVMAAMASPRQFGVSDPAHALFSASPGYVAGAAAVTCAAVLAYIVRGSR